MPTTLIPTPYQLPFAVLVLLGGLIAWVAGYRLFRLVLTVFGFVAGVVTVSLAVGAADPAMFIFAAIGGGAAGAVIMFFGYFVGVALVGAGIGAFGVHMIWSRLGSDPHAFVVILFAVAGAATAMALQRYVIIVSTAFGGSWASLWGGSEMVERIRGQRLRLDVWMVYLLDLSPSRRWYLVLAAWVLVGLLGVFIQLRYTGRSKSGVRVRTGRKQRAKSQATSN